MDLIIAKQRNRPLGVELNSLKRYAESTEASLTSFYARVA
jgi:hypothetical protein